MTSTVKLKVKGQIEIIN